MIADSSTVQAGGAPHFSRWLLLSLPSALAREQMAFGATLFANVASGRRPLHPMGVDAPLITISMSEQQYAFVMLNPEALEPELECEPVTGWDVDACRS